MIEQGTEEWHRVRWGKIGGTRAGMLFNESEALLNELFAEHTEDFELEDEYQSEAMIRGHELEPVARERLSQYIGVPILPAGWVQSAHPLLGVSPDGLSEDLTIGVEVKCPGAKEHAQTIRGGHIPLKHIPQCLHYFTCIPSLKTLYFASFRPESNIAPLFVRQITRESLVDIGWKVKGKVKEDRGKGMKEYVCESPDLRTVNEWVELALTNADKMQNKLNDEIKRASF